MQTFNFKWNQQVENRLKLFVKSLRIKSQGAKRRYLLEDFHLQSLQGLDDAS